MNLVLDTLQKLSPNATRLEIIGQPIETKALDLLIEVINDTPSLQDIMLSGCSLSNADIKRLVPPLTGHPGVCSVALPNNGISNPCVVLPLLTNRRIHTVDISGNQAVDRCDFYADFLARIINTPHLVHIGLPQNLSPLFVPEARKNVIEQLIKSKNLLKCSTRSSADQGALGEAISTNRKAAGELLDAVLQTNNPTISVHELFSYMPALVVLAREHSKTKEFFEKISSLGLERTALVEGVDLSFYTFIRQSIANELKPPPVSAAPKEEAENFSPSRSPQFERALQFCRVRNTPESNEHPLIAAAREHAGGVAGLHQLAQTLRASGIKLTADHFCQTGFGPDAASTPAFFSEKKGRRALLQSALQYVKATGQHFSAKALVNTDGENASFISACEENGLAAELFSNALWQENTAELEKLMETGGLPFPQQRTIAKLLNSLNGRPIEPLPPRNVSRFHTAEFIDLLNQSTIVKSKAEFTLYGVHPAATIDLLLGNAVDINLHHLTQRVEETTGYPFEADDFFRPFKTDLTDMRCGTPQANNIAHMMDYLKQTNKTFSHDIFSVKNSKGLTPLESLLAQDALAAFLFSDYWKNNLSTLDFLAKTEHGLIKNFVEKAREHHTASCEAIDTNNADASHDSATTDAPIPSESIFESEQFQPQMDPNLSQFIKIFTLHHTGDFSKSLSRLAKGDKGPARLEQLSNRMKPLFGRPLLADDLCRQNEEGTAAYETSLSQTLSVFMGHLKKTQSGFSLNALFHAQNGSTFLDAVLYASVTDVFFDPKYWGLFPHTLSAIAERDDRFQAPVEQTIKAINDLKKQALEKLARKAERQQALVLATKQARKEAQQAKWHKLSDAEKIQQKIEELRAAAIEIATPDNTQDLATSDPSRMDPWKYGEKIIQDRQRLSFLAMDAITACSTQSTQVEEILSFLSHFSQARSILDAYADQIQTEGTADNPQKSRTRFFDWFSFGKSETKKIVDLSEAIALAKEAGVSLQGIAPGLERASTIAGLKMTLLDTIMQANNQIADVFEQHIDAGERFISSTVPPFSANTSNELAQQTVNAPAIKRFGQRLDLLAEVRLSVLTENKTTEVTADLYGQHATSLGLQCGTTLPRLATQVAQLHQTLDLLQISAGTKSLSEATRAADESNVSKLLLAAQQTMESITTQMNGMRGDVEKLNQISLTTAPTTQIVDATEQDLPAPGRLSLFRQQQAKTPPKKLAQGSGS